MMCVSARAKRTAGLMLEEASSSSGFRIAALEIPKRSESEDATASGYAERNKNRFSSLI
jgi:hypothetical protein